MHVKEYFFSEIECYSIILKYYAKLQQAVIGKNQVNKNIRNCRTHMFHDKDLELRFSDAKVSLQLAEYIVGDHYTWHMDGLNRCQTNIILLNSEFTGGLLEFRNRPHVELNIGDCVSFSKVENLEHKVSPVISGVRYSLVAWCLE
jgi:hypothetical protein